MSDNSEIHRLSDDEDEKFEDASPVEDDAATKQTLVKELTKSLQLNDDNNSSNEDNDDIKPDDNKETFEDCQEHFLDEDSQRDYEKTLTAEELLANKNKALDLKAEGNDLFKTEKYQEALDKYTEALKLCPMDCTNERSVLYGNRAAAHIQIDRKPLAIEDCTKSLELNPTYMKALIRRAKLYEEIEKYDESLADYQKIIEIDPSYAEARQALVRLPPKIDERNEILKTEMLGKLKDLGNLILKPFGLSTNNFQMQQDPSTGSYSVNFNQNP